MTTCINCYVDYSPIWRKGYCNACGIHYSKYGVHNNHIDIYAKIICSFKKKYLKQWKTIPED